MEMTFEEPPDSVPDELSRSPLWRNKWNHESRNVALWCGWNWCRITKGGKNENCIAKLEKLREYQTELIARKQLERFPRMVEKSKKGQIERVKEREAALEKMKAKWRKVHEEMEEKRKKEREDWEREMNERR